MQKNGEMGGRRGLPKVVTYVVGALTIALVSCAKISDFREPYLKETFMGALGITPSLTGLEPSGRGTGVITIVGNKSGTAVTIYGMPKNEPFTLLPRISAFEPAPTVSGFDAEVVDRRTLRVTGFSSTNELADNFEVEVTGLFYREGPTFVTKEPIIIKAKAKAIKDYIPEDQLEKITRVADGASIDEIDDEEMVPMYEITFVGQITSIF